MHKLIQASIMAAIGVIIFSSLLVPIIDGAQDGYNETFTNTGAGQVYVTEVKEDTVINYTGTALTINDVNIPAFGSRCSFTSDNAFMYHGGTPGSSKIFAWDGDSYENPTFTEYTATIDVDTKTITIIGLVDSVETTINCSYNWCYVTAIAGDYISIDSNFSRDFYINSINDIKSVEYNNAGYVFSSNGGVLRVNGVDQGTVNYTTTEINDYTNLEKIHVEKLISNTGLYYTFNNNDYSVHWTIAPYTVQAHLNADDSIIQLFGVIPLIVIFGLIFAVVGAVVYQRIE